MGRERKTLTLKLSLHQSSYWIKRLRPSSLTENRFMSAVFQSPLNRRRTGKSLVNRRGNECIVLRFSQHWLSSRLRDSSNVGILRSRWWE